MKAISLCLRTNGNCDGDHLPHALGVAIPLVVAISTTLSATNGSLIRNRTAFETTRKLSTIIFDKTGTLTEGSHSVKQIIQQSNNYSER